MKLTTFFKRAVVLVAGLGLGGLSVATAPSASAGVGANLGIAFCNSCGGGPANIVFTGAAQEIPTLGTSGLVDVPVTCEGVADNAVLNNIAMHCWLHDRSTGANYDASPINSFGYPGNVATEDFLVQNIPADPYDLCMDVSYTIGTLTWSLPFNQAACFQPL